MSDRQNGTYYFNAATQQTVWEAPIEKADAATVKKDAERRRLDMPELVCLAFVGAVT